VKKAVNPLRRRKIIRDKAQVSRIEEMIVGQYVQKRVAQVLDEQRKYTGDKSMKNPESVIDVYEELMYGEETTVVDVGEDIYEKDIKIYSSTDYNKFSLVHSNRPVNYDRVNRMVKAIREGSNYLSNYPILINSDFEIIDGQHRHAAARLAQVKLYYKFAFDMDMGDAAKAVSNTKSWMMSDWLHHYAELGFPEYVKLRDFWKQYEWLPVSMLIGLSSSRKYTAAIFNGGHYQTNTLDHAKRVIDLISFFKPFAPTYWKTAAFMQTLSSLAANPLYMHKRMQDKMKTQSSRLTRQATVESYLILLSEIYNYRVAPENRAFFDEAYRRRRTQAREDAATE